MPQSLQEQISKLQIALETLENQRRLLGDAIEPAIAAAQEKLAALQLQFDAPRPADQRRQLTLFFSDVVGSVAHAERLDPEDWRAIIGTVQYQIASTVTARDGMVAQYQGDGLIAFFGAQGLREHDVEQAIHAALEAQAAIPRLALPIPLEIRIGIHTGLVLLGAWGIDSKIEFGAFGDAVNIAARLQSNAPPGGVLVSHDTYRYVRGGFEFSPPQALVLKGKSNPMPTYLVHRAKPRSFQLSTRGVPGVQARTVGREFELQRLREVMRQALATRTTVCIQLVGEPGIGKSRLVDESCEWSGPHGEPLVRLRGRALAHDQQQPFSVVRRMWFDLLQIAEDTPLALAQNQWVEGFQNLTGIREEEPAHALGLLLGLPFEDSPFLDALRLDAKQARGRAFVVSKDALHSVRKTRPVQILLEDLHWADASSLEYIQDVILQDTDAPTRDSSNGVFVLATARRERGVLSGESVTVMPLAPLSSDATLELARELLKHVEEMPPDVIQQVVERAEGVPYFVEELINYFIDRGIIDATREPWQFVRSRLLELHGTTRAPLPSTLEYLLRARLDALSQSERAALQRGAIYGRNFWSGGLHALGVNDCDESLSNLEPRGLVQQQAESALEGESEWSFHHALLRDVTYDSVLKRERPGLHQKAAEWLEGKAQESGRLDEFAALLGEHCERGGSTRSAAAWYLRAGERANLQGAAREGRQFFDRVLELAHPDERETRWRALKGREAALGRLGERARQQADLAALLELAELCDDDSRRAYALYSQARYFGAGGELRMTLVPAEHALAAARRAGDRPLQANALAILMTNRTRLGDLARARELVAEAGECARACGDKSTYALTLMQIGLHYTDAGELAQAIEPFLGAAALAQQLGNRSMEGQILSNLGYAYAQLGLYPLARSVLERTLELAQAVGERRDYAYGLQNLGYTCLCSGDEPSARQLEEQALREFSVRGDAFGHAASVLYLGHIAERVGDVAEGAALYAQALEEFTAIGVRGFMIDARAGQARCRLGQGTLEAAQQDAAHLWARLTEHGSEGIELPTLVYMTCADLFRALGQEENARAAVQAGYHELMKRADKITNPEWRTSFLENVMEHRVMVEVWERTRRHANF